MLQIISQPAVEPVSLAEARRWLRLESDDTINTPTLQLLIRALREQAENLTYRAFVQRQYRLNLDCWPACHDYSNRIELPFPPLVSVDSVKYYDTDGVLTTLATDQYVAHSESEPAYIIPAYQVMWPTTRALPNAIQVIFTAGYTPGSPQDEQGYKEVLPGSLLLWMESKLATLYENREQIIVGTIVAKLPRDFTDGLLDPLIVGTRIF